MEPKMDQKKGRRGKRGKIRVQRANRVQKMQKGINRDRRNQAGLIGDQIGADWEPNRGLLGSKSGPIVD